MITEKMFANGIIIKWSASVEYIAFKGRPWPEQSEIKSTVEYWRDSCASTRYVVRPEIKQNGRIREITIEYKPDLNGHLDKPSQYDWGLSKIYLTAAQRGKVHWWPRVGAPKRFEYQWFRVRNNLTKKIKRSKVLRIERQRQDAFRSIMLAEDSACFISGERTQAALDAAHIIRSSCGGNEVRENGIVMRADLHRLYDASAFSIGLDGKITKVCRSISSEYKTLLEPARVPKYALERIRDALKIAREKKA